MNGGHIRLVLVKWPSLNEMNKIKTKLVKEQLSLFFLLFWIMSWDSYFMSILLNPYNNPMSTITLCYRWVHWSLEKLSNGHTLNTKEWQRCDLIWYLFQLNKLYCFSRVWWDVCLTKLKMFTIGMEALQTIWRRVRTLANQCIPYELPYYYKRIYKLHNDGCFLRVWIFF